MTFWTITVAVFLKLGDMKLDRSSIFHNIEDKERSFGVEEKEEGLEHYVESSCPMNGR